MSPKVHKIAFIDTTYPEAYDFDTLAAQAIGGTESSILRTAAILADIGHEVSIIQHTRQENLTQRQVKFWSRAEGLQQGFDHVIVLRKWPQLKTYQQHFPDAQFYLWLHTYKKAEFVFKRLMSLPRPVTLIGNSATHQAHLDDCLHRSYLGQCLSLFGVKKLSVTHAYNPIPRHWSTLRSDHKNKQQMMFISAPNKGLTQVLDHFKTIKAQLPEMKLLVANPGYRDDVKKTQDGVEWLGALPQQALLSQVAKSLCVLYPQTTFAETFGLIYAEANAVGTPVLAHDIGSAREILHPENPLVNGHEVAAIIQLLKQWQSHPPNVSYRDVFDDAAVAKQWQSILGFEIDRQ